MWVFYVPYYIGTTIPFLPTTGHEMVADGPVGSGCNVVAFPVVRLGSVIYLTFLCFFVVVVGCVCVFCFFLGVGWGGCFVCCFLGGGGGGGSMLYLCSNIL